MKTNAEIHRTMRPSVNEGYIRRDRKIKNATEESNFCRVSFALLSRLQAAYIDSD